jgi:hypothetical protein
MFGTVMQSSFVWLSIPLIVTVAILLIPSFWWPANPLLLTTSSSPTATVSKL